MKLFRDIESPRLIVWKGFLFLLCGLLAAAGLFVQSPSLSTAALIGVVAWCFSRWYYFLFYVIERYVDPTFKFAGVGSAIRFLWRAKREEGARRQGGPM